MKSYQSLIEHKLEAVGSSGNDTIYVCPNPECDDKSGHMYVNYDREKWHCFKCGIGGHTLHNLLKLLNIRSDYNYEKLYTEQDKSLDDILSMKKKKVISERVDYSTDLYTLTEYYLCHIKPLSPIAREYLHNRGISDDMISSLCLSEGINMFNTTININGKSIPGRDYSNRIMIPSLRKDGMISFYLGRDYTDTKSNKYSNAPKEIGVASEDVWSLDIIETSSVVICEGVMTAIAVNRALGKLIACATYGKSIAKKSSDTTVRVSSQGEKLLQKNFQTYIMFYDKDALAESYASALYLYERGANVRIVKIPEDMYGPKADAGDMTDDEIRSLIINSEEFHPFSKAITDLT